ncbi:MAG: M67 family metallopeptidase [Chthonomonadales bacterium]
MRVQISRSCHRAILRHAQEVYPHECCGLLLGSHSDGVKTITRIRTIPNEHAEDQTHRYLIAPQQMLQVEREARQAHMAILGIYHSHPDHPAQPSVYDLEWAWPWYSYMIVSVFKGEAERVTCWTLSDDRTRFLEEPLTLSASGDEACPQAS